MSRKTVQLITCNDFDVKAYKELNKDLTHMNDLEAINHFKKYGYKENRKYKYENTTEDLHTTENNIVYCNPREKTKIKILLHCGYGDNYIQFYSKFIKNIISNQKYTFSIHITINENLNYNSIISHFKSKFYDMSVNTSFEVVKNYGADTYWYGNFILNNDHTSYDYLIKLHTKTFSYWTLQLLSIFLYLDDLIETFESNSDIGIIGVNRCVQPFYHGLSDLYKTELYKLLKLFDVEEDTTIDYFKLLNDNETIKNKKEFNFNEIKKYLEYRVDLYYANVKHNDCFDHFYNHRNTELNHGGYNMNDSKFIKFIAGTIFIQKSITLHKIKEKYYNSVNFLMEKVEKISYYPNFDHNGTLFRYTNAYEYILQAAIYSFNYKVYGYEPADTLNTSNYIKNLNLINPDIVIQNNKKKLLFVSNELSNTGAPIVLKNIITKLLYKYDVFLLSYYGGDNTDEFTELLGKNNVFVIYKNNQELGINNVKELIDMCSNISKIINPDIVYINTLVNIYAIYGFYNKNSKIILHIHEAETEIINLYNSGHILGYDFYKYCDKIICVNDFLMKKVDSVCKNTSTCVINNDINFYDKNINEEEKTNFFKFNTDKKIMVGGTGTICHRKGFDIFINLANLYKDLCFVWATTNDYNGYLPDNMFIINCHNMKEMTIFYKSISFLLLTSRSEAFSLAFWECLLNKKYIVASNKMMPLDPKIFYNSNIHLLDGFSSEKLFIPFLENVKNNKIDLNKLNESINIDFIKSICTKNIEKIVNIIEEQISENNVKQVEIEYPIEFELYKKLNIYNKFHSYNLQNDLIPHKFNDFTQSVNHYLNNGFNEGRQIYKFPCLVKKRVLCCFHTLSNNGATKVGLDIANNLQKYFDVIVLSWDGGKMIDSYAFENKPIVIGCREFEHDLVKYLERLEFAQQIINELNPDLIFVTSSVTHDFCHAGLQLNKPIIYHNHEGDVGYISELKGRQIPIDNFFEYYKPKNMLFYSASPLTTKCIKTLLGVNNDNIIKQFQTINFQNIDNLKHEGCLNIKNKNRKLIGMVGLPIHRKGYDIFLKLASMFREYDFCWIGDNNINNEIEYNNNLILIKSVSNPYKYIKQLDYLLCTSREDVFGLILLESLYLNVPTILLKSCISSWKIFEELGAYCLEGYSYINSFIEIVKNIHLYNARYSVDIKKIKDNYDILENIENIKNDIINLTDGFVGEIKNKSYFYDEKYGYITYNYKNIENMIFEFHKKEQFNYDIYKNKYKDIGLVLKTEEEYRNHWEKVGHKIRSLEPDDWKLFIATNEHLFYQGICSKEQIDIVNYKNISVEFNSIKYLNKYDDLKAAFNEDINAAYNHFLHNGILEGRTWY